MGNKHSHHPKPAPKPTSYPTAGECPSDSFYYCALQGEYCNIPNGINQGYMSYGSDSTISILRPFTILNNDNGWNFLCSNNWDQDEYFGTDKYCCYAPFSDIGFDASSSHYYFINQTSAIVGTAIFKQCDGSNYNGCVYSVFSNKILDEIQQIYSISDKAYISYNSSALSMINDISWTQCGNGGSYCNNLEPGSSYWIRFGDNSNDQYNYKLVAISVDGTGSIPCDSEVFGTVGYDDITGSDYLFCWKSDPLYVYSNAVGNWIQLKSCDGCPSNTYSLKFGVSMSNSRYFTSVMQSVMGKFSKGFSFNGVLDLSQEVSQIVINSVLSSFTESSETAITVTCDKDDAYQWVMGITQISLLGESQDIKIFSEEYKCMDSTYKPPQCPPSFCADDNCQNCTNNELMVNMISEDFYYNDHDNKQNHGDVNIVIAFGVGIICVLLFVFCMHWRRQKSTKRRHFMNPSQARNSYGSTNNVYDITDNN